MNGLNASVRLIKARVVGFPDELEHPTISPGFLREQLESLECALPVKAEVHFAREEQWTFLRLLTRDAVVPIASKSRPWATNQAGAAGGRAAEIRATCGVELRGVGRGGAWLRLQTWEPSTSHGTTASHRLRQRLPERWGGRTIAATMTAP